MSRLFILLVVAFIGCDGCKRDQESDFAVIVHRRAMVAAHRLGQGPDLTEAEVVDTRARCSNCVACTEICAELESIIVTKSDAATSATHH